MRLKRLAFKIVNKLVVNGYKAYFAGGCVRDKILGLPFKDIDIVTEAKPNDVMGLFRRTIPVGIQFGVIIVIVDGVEFEVATFRKDNSYIDGRHPESIKFSDELEDAKRRDFTINGMFYDPINHKIIDYVDGRKDINNRLIRSIGKPIERFNEDKLRMMRAIRFASRFGYDIEKDTWNAIKLLNKDIVSVSNERVNDELVKILTDNDPKRGIELLYESGLLNIILPEVAKLKGVEQPKDFHPEGDVFIHTLLMLKNMDNPSRELALAVLLHDVGKPSTISYDGRIRFNSHDKVGADIAKGVCKRLKLSNKSANRVVDMVAKHMKFMNVQKMRESKLKRFLRMENFSDHLELHRLDCISSHNKLDHYYFCINKLKDYSSEDNIILNPPKLIDGKVLVDMGFKPGPIFKKIFKDVESAQLENSIKTKADAIDFVNSRYKVNEQEKISSFNT